jgi:hypothetical protein
MWLNLDMTFTCHNGFLKFRHIRKKIINFLLNSLFLPNNVVFECDEYHIYLWVQDNSNILEMLKFSIFTFLKIKYLWKRMRNIFKYFILKMEYSKLSNYLTIMCCSKPPFHYNIFLVPQTFQNEFVFLRWKNHLQYEYLLM